MSILLARGTLFYLAAVNTTSAGIFCYDKFQATHNGWRVPEKRLCQTALVGGWLGGLVAMHVFRHKTRKRSFQQKYVQAITQNAIVVAPAMLVVSGVPSLRNGFAAVFRGLAAGMIHVREAMAIIGAANLLSVVITLIDKIQAIRHGRRICEKHFCVLAFCGGWPAGIFAMRLFRHKTKKPSFHMMYGFSVLLNIYVVSSYFLLKPSFFTTAFERQLHES